MTAETLKSYSVKDLAEMAKNRGVRGWHAMKKEQLVKALLRLASQTANRRAAQKSPAAKAAPQRLNANGQRLNGQSLNRRPPLSGQPLNGQRLNGQRVSGQPVNGQPHNGQSHNGQSHNGQRITAPAPVVARKPSAQKDVAQKDAKEKKLSLVAKRILLARMKQDRMKDLAWRTAENNKNNRVIRDRLVVMVRDAYWLHCYWELSRQGVERAQAALAQDWHTARPVLRLLHVAEGGTTSAAESLVRDIDIHGGVNNWYIETQDAPKSFRIEIGYRAANGRFQMLARSNIVTTPRPDSKDAIDENWSAVAQDYDKIYAMSGGYSPDGHSVELQELFEERLRRPMGSPMVTGFGSGVEGLVPRRKDFHFEVDAEIIVFGTTEPNAHVTLQGEPVKVRPDGTFTVRFAMPNARQVIPAVASSVDGLEQRTVVLAIERNTKVMEPVVKDVSES